MKDSINTGPVAPSIQFTRIGRSAALLERASGSARNDRGPSPAAFPESGRQLFRVKWNTLVCRLSAFHRSLFLREGVVITPAGSLAQRQGALNHSLHCIPVPRPSTHVLWKALTFVGPTPTIVR